MGIIRGITKYFVKFLLIISIALFISISTGAHFLDKSTLSPIIGDVVIGMFSDVQMNEFNKGLNIECDNIGNKSIDVQSPFGTGDIKVNCTALKEKQVNEVKTIFKEQIVSQMIENLSSVECKNIDCIQKGPQGLLSSSFNKFLKTLSLLFILISILLIAALFFLCETLPGKFIGIGSPLLVSGLPFLFMNALKNQINNGMQENAAILMPIVDKLFEYLSSRFLIIFVLGAALIIAGIVLKIVFRKKK